MKTLLGLGDSIMNGYGDIVAGVPAMSPAAWVALANGLACVRHSLAGKTSQEILDELVPCASDHYDVALISAGTNDILQPEWEPQRTAETVGKIVAGIGTERVLLLGLPRHFHAVPGIPRKIRDRAPHLVEVLRQIGEVVDLADVPRRYYAYDRLHPNALGMLEIADRTARHLGLIEPRTLQLGTPGGQVELRFRRRAVHQRAKLSARSYAKQALGRW